MTGGAKVKVSTAPTHGTSVMNLGGKGTHASADLAGYRGGFRGESYARPDGRSKVARYHATRGKSIQRRGRSSDMQP